jgi:hypothetical protein
MDAVAKGECLCGDFRYHFSKTDALSSFHCHCKDCQRSTGSGKATIVLVPTTSLVTEGELKTYTVTGTDGAHVTRGFCPNCGSQVLSYVEELPSMRFIKAGALIDSAWLKVESSCWTSSAVPWSPVESDSAAFAMNPEMSL